MSTTNPVFSSVGAISSKQSTDQETLRRQKVLREHLPNLQPQEGSPANTFTNAELKELSVALNIAPGEVVKRSAERDTKADVRDVHWSGVSKASTQRPFEDLAGEATSWHGAPHLDDDCIAISKSFREEVRAGRFTGPTNGQCPGFLQCNLVVLPQGRHAFDFLLFCQRNKKACPLIEVCDVGSPFPDGIARGADLRTDVPKYAIYKDGALEKEVDDVTDYWPEDSVAFLIGCSFSYDGALLDAQIPLRSAEQGKNVPMFKTNLKCRSSGSLSGCMVVSMKPIKATDVAREVEITSKFPHAHGAPVCIGCPASIGIYNLDEPDWGEAVEMQPDEVPVFHACGVTPQSILMSSKVAFAITHSAGHMFVSDLPSDTHF